MAQIKGCGGLKLPRNTHLTMRWNYGETWNATPEIIGTSYRDYTLEGLDNTYATYVLDVKLVHYGYYIAFDIA
ncbi:MAG TPA: hypothetical protein VHX11_10625, partial [Acidobacteriaceae bacterium]|nr:hypothetical protein [Acidobacteriaceae bacterium]